MINQNRDQLDPVTQIACVAGAPSAKGELQPIADVLPERNPFEIGDHDMAVTQKVRVASAEPTRIEPKPTRTLSARASLSIGDHCRRVTQLSGVPAAARAIDSVQPRRRLRGRRPFPQIGGQWIAAAHFRGAPGERSTRNLVKPQIEPSSARAFPEIGRHLIDVTQSKTAPEADRHINPLPKLPCNPSRSCGG